MGEDSNTNINNFISDKIINSANYNVLEKAFILPHNDISITKDFFSFNDLIYLIKMLVILSTIMFYYILK